MTSSAVVRSAGHNVAKHSRRQELPFVYAGLLLAYWLLPAAYEVE
jgi:hypothetical protein